MRYRVLGCYGSEMPGFNLSSFLVDDVLLIDAGAVTSRLTLQEQAGLEFILLTHVHLDHVKGLPFLGDNLYGLRQRPIQICGIPSVIRDIEAHLLNDVIWPDFTRILSADSPILSYRPIPEGAPVRLADFEIVAVRVNHQVDCVAFFVTRGGATILHVGDTGPTDEVWQVAQQFPNLQAVTIETSFPNRLQELADATRHLTPNTLRRELKKLGRDIPVYVYHLKPQFSEEIVSELKGITSPPTRLLRQGRTYRF